MGEGRGEGIVFGHFALTLTLSQREWELAGHALRQLLMRMRHPAAENAILG